MEFHFQRANRALVQNYPDLLFLAVLENGKENPPKSKDFYHCQTLKNFGGEKEKTLEKTRNASKHRKQGNPKRQEQESRARKL